MIPSHASRDMPFTIIWLGWDYVPEPNIIVETGVARDSHHFACLIGYGATAVYPYLVYQSLHDLARKGSVDRSQQFAEVFDEALEKVYLKSCQKWASLPLQVIGAQLFEMALIA